MPRIHFCFSSGGSYGVGPLRILPFADHADGHISAEVIEKYRQPIGNETHGFEADDRAALDFYQRSSKVREVCPKLFVDLFYLVAHRFDRGEIARTSLFVALP